MSRFAGLIQSVDDHANPVVVKELRQAVQNRMVIAVLMLSLLVNVVVTSVFLALSHDFDSGLPAGITLYQVLYGILVGTCMFFVPLYAAARMTLERNHSNIDLLYITTIPPSAIVRGKFWAAAALTGLIYSASMPFLSLTYLLRGIDLPSIFVSLGFSFLCTLLSIMVAIFAGSIPTGMFMRVLLGLGLLYFGAIMVAMTVGMGITIVQGGLGAVLGTPNGLAVAGIGLVLGSTALMLFYLLSVASISTKSSNRMFPIRVFATVCWLAWGITAVVWGLNESNGFPILSWMVCSSLLLSVTMGLMPCERETWTPRVRRSIPGSSLPRFLCWLFYTGSAGGMLWCLALALGTLGGSMLYAQRFPTHFLGNEYSSGFLPMALLLLLTWCYTMCGVLLRRWLAPWSPPGLASVLGLTLLGLGGIVPLFVAYTVLGMNSGVHQLPLVFLIANPFVILNTQIDRGTILAFLISWAVLMLLLNFQWFRLQWKAFRRYVPAAEAASSPNAVVASEVASP